MSVRAKMRVKVMIANFWVDMPKEAWYSSAPIGLLLIFFTFL